LPVVTLAGETAATSSSLTSTTATSWSSSRDLIGRLAVVGGTASGAIAESTLISTRASTARSGVSSGLARGLGLGVALGGAREGLLDRLHRARRLVILLVIAEEGEEVL